MTPVLYKTATFRYTTVTKRPVCEPDRLGTSVQPTPR